MFGGSNHRVSPQVTLKKSTTTTTTTTTNSVITPVTNEIKTNKQENPIPKSSKKKNTPFNQKIKKIPTKTKPKKPKLTPQEIIEKYPLWKRKLLYFLDAKWFTALMLVVTLYALFGDDIRSCLFSKQADDIFFFLASFSLFLFSIEFFVSCYVKPGYLCSFYFVLDFIATFSVLPDIGWIWKEIVGTNGNQSTSALKASKATRAGSKAGRIVRVIRAVRLFRVVKILKWKHKEEDQTIQLTESKVGSKMGEVTVQRVVILVLFLIMVLPLFDGGYNSQEYRYQEIGLKTLHMIATMGTFGKTIEFDRLFEGYVRDAGKLVYLQITNKSNEEIYTKASHVRFQPIDEPNANYSLTKHPITGWSAEDLFQTYDQVETKFRDTELNIVRTYGCYNETLQTKSSTGNDDKFACYSMAIFDISTTTADAAAYNILKTVFIIVVLIVASTLFVRVSRKLVLEPIERMMNIVQKLADDPLASVKTAGNEAAIRKAAKEEGFETALLELTLSKVGRLMQVGFGAAGADIIGKNMGSGELDPMLPGKKITAIYGFCDIRQFTDTTECLQEEVMVYVNKLGNIMHTGTHHYYGMANKNVGDAFLLSWKICDGELSGFSRFSDTPTEEDRLVVNQTFLCPPNPGAGTKSRRITPTEMAESALTAFIKCMIDLDNANTDGVLTEYIKRENVIKRFGNGFRIKMGFGMHVGWAVEGAIGSTYKIDATYISPHVEMADRLEAGSKMFGTPINLSHWFVALLSPGARKFLRKMDRISIRGVDTPLTVYTFDVTVMKKGFGTPRVDTNSGLQEPVDFENDPEYQEIREGLEPAFVESAASAVDAYIAGDWPKARHYLKHAQQIRPNDGPCKHLMNVLKEFNFEAPTDWKGYRYVSGY